MIKPEDIYAFLGFIVSLAGLWIAFQSKMTTQEKRIIEQENRITTIELRTDRNREQIELHQRRLDNHDVDNKIMLALVEKVDALKEDIAEIKQDLKKG